MIDYKDELEKLQKEVKAFDGLKATNVALQAKCDKLEKFIGEQKEDGTLGAELKAFSDEIALLQTEIKGLKAEEQVEKFIPFADAIKAMVESKEFKAAKEGNGFKGAGTEFELKVDTTSMTGTYTRTQAKDTISFLREDPNDIAPLFNTIPLGAGKSTVLWMDGTYTSNAGYAGEGAAIGSFDSGSAKENTRGLAKISAKLKLTAEMLEDLPSLAAIFQMKLQDKVRKFLNTNLLTGDGNDATAKTHIYGLTTQGCTPFSAGVFALKIAKPTIDDLVAVMIAQANNFSTNVVLINPVDAIIKGRIKGTDGQYIIREVNGMKMLGGLRVIETHNIAANTMMTLDTSVLELHMKRNLEFKIAQEGNDLSSDQYTAVVFLRCQELVETLNKAGNIYVSDIEAAITAITKA